MENDLHNFLTRPLFLLRNFQNVFFYFVILCYIILTIFTLHERIEKENLSREKITLKTVFHCLTEPKNTVKPG